MMVRADRYVNRSTNAHVTQTLLLKLCDEQIVFGNIQLAERVGYKADLPEQFADSAAREFASL